MNYVNQVITVPLVDLLAKLELDFICRHCNCERHAEQLKVLLDAPDFIGFGVVEHG